MNDDTLHHHNQIKDVLAAWVGRTSCQETLMLNCLLIASPGFVAVEVFLYGCFSLTFTLHSLSYSLWICKSFDLLPFHPSLNRWNHRTADSRHIVQECPRGSLECSGECSVLQQQGYIVLHEVILSAESGYAHALTSICVCIHLLHLAVFVCVCDHLSV